MIAGETENIIGLDTENSFYEYDELFGLGGKKKRVKQVKSPEEIAAKKAKRKQFWSGVDNKVRESGGIEGITSSLGNVLGMFRRSPGNTPSPPSDYQLGLAGNTPEKRGIPTAVYVVGGVLVTGLAAWGIMYVQKSKIKTEK